MRDNRKRSPHQVCAERGLSCQDLEEALGEGISHQKMDAIHSVYEAVASVGGMLDLSDGVADDEHKNRSVSTKDCRNYVISCGDLWD